MPILRGYTGTSPTDKCVTVVFGGRPRALYPNFKGYIPELKAGSELIRTSERMKYLGVVFDYRFTFCIHVDYVLEKARKIYFARKKYIFCLSWSI